MITMTDSNVRRRYIPLREPGEMPHGLTSPPLDGPYVPLTFAGGPILGGPELVTFYWGAFTDGDTSTMQAWLAGLAGYLAGRSAPGGQEPVLFQYGISGAVAGVFHVDDVLPADTHVSEGDVRARVEAGQLAGDLPGYSSERLFLVLTRGLTFDGLNTVWCGYHGDWGNGRYFAICPEPTVSGCLPTGETTGSWESLLAHEIFEACTDPRGGSGWVEGGEEGGDSCNRQWTTLSFGVTQRFADNRQRACSVYTPAESSRVCGIGQSGRYDLFFPSPTGSATHWWFEGDVWRSEDLGLTAIGRMAVVSPAPGRLDLFAHGIDHAVWTTTMQRGVAGPWIRIGGLLIGDPAPISRAPGQVDLFVHGIDGNLYQSWLEPEGWHDWVPIRGQAEDLVGTPAIISRGGGLLDILSRGTNFHLMHNAWDGERWVGWEQLGGQLRTKPIVVTRTPDHLDVFARGQDDSLQHLAWHDGWAGWESLGGVIRGEPAAISRSATDISVFVHGTDDGLWSRVWNGAWHDYAPLDGIIEGAPVPLSNDPSQLHVFVRGTDGALWVRWSDAAGWHDYQRIGGVIG